MFSDMFDEELDKKDEEIKKLKDLLAKHKKLFQNILYVDPRPDLSLHKYHSAIDLIHAYAKLGMEEK